MFVLALQEGKMDRKGQLGNVAFGGAWSEEIAGRERLQAAIQTILAAAAGAADDDPRRSHDVQEALILATESHPKRDMLRTAWWRGAGIEDPGRRVAELSRIATIIERAISR